MFRDRLLALTRRYRAIDNETPCLLKKALVIWEGFASGTPEMANRFATTLQQYKIAMLRGHSDFKLGQTLDEAFHWSSLLVESCPIAVAAKIINEPFIEYRGMSGGYSKW
jgi:L-fuculose-phosphate aldolase